MRPLEPQKITCTHSVFLQLLPAAFGLAKERAQIRESIGPGDDSTRLVTLVDYSDCGNSASVDSHSSSGR